jgi:PfaD family protein
MTTTTASAPTRTWHAGATGTVAFSPAALTAAAERIREPASIVRDRSTGRLGVAFGGDASDEAGAAPGGGFDPIGSLPPMYPEWLGDRSFTEVHRVRFPYVVGEMAQGVATPRMVLAASKAGLLGFFGAAGLAIDRIEAAIHEIAAEAGPGVNWGVNLIHSPESPEDEERVATLLVRHAVPTISASAFMSLTPAVAYAAAAGARLDAAGRIVRARRIVAKLSRPEVAAAFMSPPPEAMLRALVARGLLSEGEAGLAARMPVAEDVTVEADSGGHTDNRPLVALLPAILSARDRVVTRHGFTSPIRVGAAGGLATPAAVAAAFALGSAYVLTGSINQCAVESGLSRAGKAMLAAADLADVAMAPSADMFELGVKVQVLRRGTLFAARASRLYDTYSRYDSLDSLPVPVRTKIEQEILRTSIADAWQATARYWQRRDPRQVEKAARDPKHRMALTFRSYLGLSSQWAIGGETDREGDFQIWCGPAMGAFNRWVADSFLADPGERTVEQIALNLLEGAAVVTRAQQLRSVGVPIPASTFDFRPRRLG